MKSRLFCVWQLVVAITILLLSGCNTPFYPQFPSSKIQTVSPVPTSEGTMPIEEQAELVTELLKTNAGCKLPCWWGFIPGETRWETVQGFYLPLGRKLYTLTQEGYRISFYEPEYRIPVQLFFAVNSKDVVRMIHVRPTMWAEEDKPDMIYGGAYYAQILKQWMLPNILSEFGKPTEIWVRNSYETPLINSSPLYYYDEYELTLYYLERGIAITYYGRSLKQEPAVYICPRADALNLSLDLWSPQEHLSSVEVFSGAPWNSKKVSDNLRDNISKFYRSLEEVAGIDIDTFYEIYRQENARECLKTPSKIWE